MNVEEIIAERSKFSKGTPEYNKLSQKIWRARNPEASCYQTFLCRMKRQHGNEFFMSFSTYQVFRKFTSDRSGARVRWNNGNGFADGAGKQYESFDQFMNAFIEYLHAHEQEKIA